MKLNDYLKNKLEHDKKFKEIYDTYDLRFEISELITEARIYKNLTQAELAQLIGTKQSSISRIESGEILPNLSFLEKIAEAIGTYLIAPKFGFMVENEKLVTATTTPVDTQAAQQDIASEYYPDSHLFRTNSNTVQIKGFFNNPNYA